MNDIKVKNRRVKKKKGINYDTARYNYFRSNK